jgi:hypothetical protein
VDNFFTDNPDMQWYFDHPDLEEVVSSLEDGYTQARQFDDAPFSYADALQGYRAVLELLGAITAQEIAPLAPEVDREGAHFQAGQVSYPRPPDPCPGQSDGLHAAAALRRAEFPRPALLDGHRNGFPG